MLLYSVEVNTTAIANVNDQCTQHFLHCPDKTYRTFRECCFCLSKHKNAITFYTHITETSNAPAANSHGFLGNLNLLSTMSLQNAAYSSYSDKSNRSLHHIQDTFSRPVTLARTSHAHHTVCM